MNSKEFEALLRAEVEEAKAHYESAQRALEAYLGNASKDDGLPRRRSFPDRQPTSVAVAVRKIIPQFTDDFIFTAEDVFGAMGMVTGYEKMRSSISSTLTRLVNEGRIEKVNRRCFRKSMQAQTMPDGPFIPKEGMW